MRTPKRNRRSAASLPIASQRRSILKIVAVDDEPSIATSMHYIFARPRYELTSACDGDDALAQLSADPAPFDVIITDERMPHLSGVELVRELKERGFRGKIMVLSAHLTPSSATLTRKWTWTSCSTNRSTFTSCARRWTSW